jgi:hypothetical protein
MGFRGNGTAAVRSLRAALRTMPLTLARDVTQRAAPALTTITRTSFDSGLTIQGESRPQSVNGGDLTLVRTGAVRDQLRFVATDKVVRCTIGPSYARYLIGKYGILPSGNAALPSPFVRKLTEIVADAKTGLPT